uniref:DAZ interacting zinc finger protein 1 n=1 Tax=Xiphophorus couchianus TaxID=32473 RepID=A0A3B5MVF2_9TELE
HSSAGIPSLLNSPLSQQSAALGMAPAAFKFRPRRESVDWRRINAVDVDLVASQLDVDALQEHIGTVTFCSLDGERCQRCQTPVDPALVKLLRLAQLSVEWLLHCQEVLSANLRGAEERLAAAAGEREQLLALHRKQEEKVKALMGELKQRKKVIRTQQSLLAPRIMSSHKCAHCDKSFLNSSFLQNHMQRRHPDEHQMRKSVQQSMHKELLRELERFKAEEMARMDRKLEDSRDGMRREMEFLYNRNIQALTVRGTKPLRSLLLLFTASVELKFFKLTPFFLFPGSKSESDGQAGQTKQPRQLSGTTRHHPDASSLTLLTGLCEVMQVRPRSSSLPSRASQAVPAATVIQPKTPQPAPRTKGFIHPKTSTPNMKTPPFSSDEDSQDSVSDLEEEPPHLRRVKSLNLMVQNKPPPVLSRQSAVSQSSFSSKPQQSRQGAMKTVSGRLTLCSVLESEELELFCLFPDKVADLARKVELHISERAIKKPAGGVSVLPERKDEVQELSLTDLEESSEWMVSSLEDKPGASKQTSFRGSGPLRKSLDSSSTSVWGTSTGKAPKSGQSHSDSQASSELQTCWSVSIAASENELFLGFKKRVVSCGAFSALPGRANMDG